MIWTTRINVESTTGDDYDDAGPATITATGVRAHVARPSGQRAHAMQERVDATVLVEPSLADVGAGQVIVDVETGQRWTVLAAQRRRGLGLDHWDVAVRRWEGRAL